MTASIALDTRRPDVAYVLRLGDTCLVLAQRLSEWCGHAPVLEEDIALANIALDLVGQARALLTHAAALEGRERGRTYTEDELAFLREERDYLNPTLVELPNGPGGQRDFAFTLLRICMVAGFLELLWARLAEGSSDETLRGIAAKAVKEARYHHRHAADWVVRLGDGTDESHRRCVAALGPLARYAAELFEADAVDAAARESGLGPSWAELREPWRAQLEATLAAAGLPLPAEAAFRSTGKRGVHSEHMGPLLAEMQHLQRAYPGAVW